MSVLKISTYTQTFRKFSSKIRLNDVYRESSAANIRNTFLDYFIKGHEHRFIRSSPVTPYCDPTVPFVNAGMNQFKNVFLGKAPAPCERAVNSQKCVRISGKHNDLNIIGTDGYHHTFFEMLGNWSFGNYYKDTACKLAWDLLTNSYMIDGRRLYVTYFGGDEQFGLKPDEECREIWRSIGVPDDHILPFGSGDNFWEMGLSGPCGPCTEIHIDHLPNSTTINRAQHVNAGRADLTEIWNLVFIEYNRKLDGTIEHLKEKYIDTGMGFERLVAVLQGKSSNYDTDLFTPIFDAIHKETKVEPYNGIYDATDSRYNLDYAYRVLADHARMCSVCIADGMYPQTNNRLRKIVRRTLNICENVFKNENLVQKAIVPEIVNILGHVYPELEKKCENIKETFSFEYEHYKSLQAKNLKEFHSLNISPESHLTEEDTIDYGGFPMGYREVEKLIKSQPSLKLLPVDFMYDQLHVKYGLPEELIEKIADEKNLTVDINHFAEHKQIKKLEAKMSHQKLNNTLLNSISLVNTPKTDYNYMYDYQFDSNTKLYNIKPIKAKIQAIQSNGNLFNIVLDKTNFYHTAGGQDGDIGKIIDATGNVFIVEATEIDKGYVIHSGKFENQLSEGFQVNLEVELHVEPTNRTRLSQHHTGMHLLQAAMKCVTGQIVFQQSSHVTSNELKCDLGFIGKRIDNNQLSQIENLIQSIIQSKVPIETKFLIAQDLYTLDNVTIIPGEIYPDENIRVLQIKDQNNDFESIEPCCGTHAQNTGDLDDFCITSFKYNGSTRTYDVTAIAGELVAQAKESKQIFLKKFNSLISKVNVEHSADEWKMIALEANDLLKELANNQIPHETKANALIEMEKIKKKIHTSEKAQLRKSILTEMIDVLDKRDRNNETFIIHVLNTKDGLEPSLMADAESVCNDLPVIILNVSSNQIIHGHSLIPTKYSSNKFNAKHWIKVLADSLKINCESNKKKKQFEVCGFLEIPQKQFTPSELNSAIEKAAIVAKKAFNELVLADQNERSAQEKNLITRIDNIRDKLNLEHDIPNLMELDSQTKDIRNHMKNNPFKYTTKEKCIANLVKINEIIRDTWTSIEMNLVDLELSDSSFKNSPYIFHAIKTEHMLVYTMMYATDINKDIPNILINISKNDVIGRVSIPLKYTNDELRAKHLADTFIEYFDGKCTHDSTRYDASICDFRLNPKLVNDDKLKNIFKKVENLLKKIVSK